MSRTFKWVLLIFEFSCSINILPCFLKSIYTVVSRGGTGLLGLRVGFDFWYVLWCAGSLTLKWILLGSIVTFKLIGRKTKRLSLSFLHNPEKQGLHFLWKKFQICSGWLWPTMKFIRLITFDNSLSFQAKKNSEQQIIFDLIFFFFFF